MTYEQALLLHDSIVTRRIVRMQTDGVEWWVEYVDRFTGKWRRIT